MDNINLEFKAIMAKVLEIFNGNVSEVARQAGIAQPSAKRWIDGESDPQMSNLVRLAQASKVNIAWLAAGEGPMMCGGEASSQKLSKVITAPAFDVMGNEVNIDEFVFLPRYDVYAAAGYGYFNRETETPIYTVPFRHDYIEHSIQADPVDLFLIGTKNDSMKGVIDEEDDIMVNGALTKPNNGIFVVRIGDSLIVKHIQVMPGRKMLVKSANPAYEPFVIDLNDEYTDMQIIGKAVWRAGVLL